LPANQLPLALWLESDRMRSLKVTQENLDNQRQAVQEEKRLRYDNQPYINAFLLINELIFKNPANAHSTIGSMEDLDAATIDDVREFFRVYYAPNNAVLTVVGDFDMAWARTEIEKYFADIPSQPKPPAVDEQPNCNCARAASSARSHTTPARPQCEGTNRRGAVSLDPLRHQWQYRRWDCQSQRLERVHIDEEFECGRLCHR